MANNGVMAQVLPQTAVSLSRASQRHSGLGFRVNRPFMERRLERDTLSEANRCSAAIALAIIKGLDPNRAIVSHQSEFQPARDTRAIGINGS